MTSENKIVGVTMGIFFLKIIFLSCSERDKKSYPDAYGKKSKKTKVPIIS
jgi:hypothetical protein